MARLIDVEKLIERLLRFADRLVEWNRPVEAEAVRTAAKAARLEPAVDAVEVVRCKDCKHWLKDVPGCTDAVGRCEFANYMVGAVGYCVYVERRTDER